MSTVVFDINMSLDGFVTVSNRSPGNLRHVGAVMGCRRADGSRSALFVVTNDLPAESEVGRPSAWSPAA